MPSKGRLTMKAIKETLNIKSRYQPDHPRSRLTACHDSMGTILDKLSFAWSELLSCHLSVGDHKLVDRVLTTEIALVIGILVRPR